MKWLPVFTQKGNFLSLKHLQSDKFLNVMEDGKVALLEKQYYFTGFWTNFTIDFQLKNGDNVNSESGINTNYNNDLFLDVCLEHRAL